MKKCILGYCQLSNRILVVELKGKPFKKFIIVVYAPTPQSTEKIEKFYSMFDNVKAQCKLQEIIMVVGDLNAKVGDKRA